MVIFTISNIRTSSAFSVTIVKIRVVIVYIACIAVVNAALGSNYLFISRKPPESTALDLLPPWPWYVAPMVLVFVLSMAMLWLPFAVRSQRRRAGPARET